MTFTHNAPSLNESLIIIFLFTQYNVSSQGLFERSYKLK